jgi:hypothetical protein
VLSFYVRQSQKYIRHWRRIFEIITRGYTSLERRDTHFRYGIWYAVFAKAKKWRPRDTVLTSREKECMSNSSFTFWVRVIEGDIR